MCLERGVYGFIEEKASDNAIFGSKIEAQH